MKKLLLFIVVCICILLIVNENLTIVSNLLRTMALLTIYLLAKKYKVWSNYE